MQFLMLGLMVFSLALERGVQIDGPTPEAQYESLVREYNESLSRARVARRTAKADAQKEQAVRCFQGSRFSGLASWRWRGNTRAVPYPAMPWCGSSAEAGWSSTPSRRASH